MKKFFCFGLIIVFGMISFFTCRAYCQNVEKKHILDITVVALADRIELVSEMPGELPVIPMRVIDDPVQIKNIMTILKGVILRPQCDCRSQYALNFYKDNVLLAAIPFSPQDGFLRYEGNDYTLPKELLSVLEL